MGGGWLPPVKGYDFHDDINGYAGILGRAIDAISIKEILMELQIK
jgi:hypothetical protein